MIRKKLPKVRKKHPGYEYEWVYEGTRAHKNLLKQGWKVVKGGRKREGTP